MANDVSRTFSRLAEFVNHNPALVRRGRYFSDCFLIGVADTPIHVTAAKGSITEVKVGEVLMRSWRFSIRADAYIWRRFWEPIPAPGFNDLLALARFQRVKIEGDLQPLVANLRYIKEVLESPRCTERQPKL